MTQKVDYALFLLTILAQSSERLSLRGIADRNSLSFSFLQKMAGLLRSAGLIRASRGNIGGYILAKPCSTILFGDVVRAVEGESIPHACVSEKSTVHACPRKALCTIRPALQKLHTQMQHLYLSKPLTYFIQQS